MKLQRLTIRNIASIEEAVIDFEHGPLAYDSLFLICGETGAGKTTLLDAICLALYNETPRMDRAENEKYRDLTFSSKKENIAINDNRQLMRRNTSEAWAELDFIGSNETPYTASWYVARAHRKLTGTVQNAKWTWENHHTHQQLTKASDIKAEIKQAIGLNFDQFCRTTLLAQGDFTRFLQSKESEKSDILEKLTGTGIYSEIGSEIYAITRQKRLDYEEQKQKTANIPLLTEEEQAEINRQIENHVHNTRTLTRQKDELAKKRDWLTRQTELDKTQEERGQALKEKQAHLQSEDFRTQEKLIDDWRTASDARHQLNQRKETATQLHTYTRQAETLKQTFVHLESGCLWLAEHTAQELKQHEKIVQYLNDLQPYRRTLEQSQTIVSQLESVMKARQRIAQFDQNIKQAEEKRPACEKDCADKKALYDQLVEASRQKQAETDSLNDNLAGMNRDQHQIRKETLETQLNKLNNCLHRLDLLNEKQQTLQAATDNEQKLTNQLTACQQQHPHLLTAQEQARKAYDECRALYEQQKDALTDWAKEARARLQTGSFCPVCGQKVTVLHKDEDFQSALRPIEQLKKNKEQALQTATNALTTNQTQQRTYDNLLKQSRQTCEKLRQDHQTARQEVDKLLADLEFAPDETRQRDIIVQRIRHNEEVLNKEKDILHKAQELDKRIAKLQQEKDKNQKQTNAAQAALQVSEKRLETLDNYIKSQQALIGNETAIIRQTLADTHSLMDWDNWQTEWDRHPEHFIQRLSETAKRHTQAQEKLKTLKTSIAQAEQELHTVAETRQAVALLLPDGELPPAEEPTEVKQLNQAWNRLHTQASSIGKGISTARETLQKQEEWLAAFYKKHPLFDEAYLTYLCTFAQEDIAAKEKERKDAQEAALTAKTAYEIAHKQVQEHLAQKPEMEEGDAPDTLTDRIARLEEDITRSQQAVGELRARLETHRQNLLLVKDERKRTDELQAACQQWNRLCHHFGDDKGKTFRNIAQSFVLKELLNRANDYLRRLTARYALECQAGSLTILLRDFHQGGTARPACTLSGGESFLVSLSLALGLSSLNRQSLSMDTLFIDEGFGSLSSDYLNTVMDTLEKLHQMGGKKVGIISHVEGLKERIHTQIQVKRVDNSRSRVEIKGAF